MVFGEAGEVFFFLSKRLRYVCAVLRIRFREDESE